MASFKPERAFTRLHVFFYRLSGGKFGNKIANLPVGLLTTTGRKTGKPFTTPLAFIKNGDEYLVTASAGGSDKDPGWFLNLKKKPEVTFEVGDKALNLKAAITEGDERTQLYEKFKAASDNFGQYEKKTARVIPVIRLKP